MCVSYCNFVFDLLKRYFMLREQVILLLFFVLAGMWLFMSFFYLPSGAMG